MTDLNIFLAFGAGVLSFISPCCLPLYPAFLSYITGMSISDIKEENVLLQKRSLLHTVFFLIGFSIVFIVLGLSTTYIYALFVQNMDLIRQIGAVFIVFFGLVTLGLVKPEFLMKERRFEFKNRPGGLLGSALIGLAFACGWTPCMGPILGAVIALSATNPQSGFIYMLAYVLGFSVPFLVMTFFVGRLQWIKKHSMLMMKIGGMFMVAAGIMLFFDWMNVLISWLTVISGGVQGF